MGEAKAKKSATAKFVAEYPNCCYCSGTRPAVTREHMPPKALFNNSHRPDKLVMPACDECNRETSTADLVASIISRWNYITNEQASADHTRLVARVRKNNPGLIREWTSLNIEDRLDAITHLRNYGVSVPADAGLASIGPLTIRQLNLFAHKVALALYFEHFKVPLSVNGRFCAFWRTKEDFAKGGIPPELLEMMKQYGTLEQGKWSAHEIFEYRYEINNTEGLFACLARLRGNLFVTGLVTEDATTLEGENMADDWIKPIDLLTILTDARFETKV
jgi:hypothetical protein